MKPQELIYEGNRTRIYVDATTRKGLAVVIKVPQKSFPTEEEITELKREFHIIRHLDIPGVRQAVAESTIDGDYAIFLEYISGDTLKNSFVKQRRSISDILDVAIAITQTLHSVHKEGVIHNDLNSQNILFSSELEPCIRIIDFGLSFFDDQAPKEEDFTEITYESLESARGTISYMAPEQTGRMNRPVDARSDLYSLGVSLYEMLTGELPFKFDDAAAMIHAHLALQATAPHLKSHDNEIPEIVSDIVMKLLAKNPDDRYQNANSLLADLIRCKESLDRDGQIRAFTLGQADQPGQLHISAEIYGRGKELAVIDEVVEAIIKGETHLLLIEGDAGVGKTRLAQETQAIALKHEGFFIEGRFDPLKQNIPYAAWIQAFENLIDVLLTLDEEKLNVWRSLMKDALGNYGKMLTDVVPRLELIIGPQPKLAELGSGLEMQNRFNLTLQKFIDALSISGHPLIIFLDNWQWADAASAELLKTIFSQRHNDYILVICAYRQSHKSESIFDQVIDDLQAMQIKRHTLLPQNLEYEDIRAWAADSLQVSEEYASSLSEIIYQKTHGNIFFARQLLRTIYEEGLLKINSNSQPTWDLHEISKLTTADNVGELLADKLRKLDSNSLTTIQAAAVAGNQFSHDLLGFLLNFPENLEQNLDYLVLEGILIPLNENETQDGKTNYKFAHQGIRETAYTLLTNKSQQEYHLRLGQYMLLHTPEDQMDENIFDIVHQLNLGANALDNEANLPMSNLSRSEIARLNMVAARKAKLSAAYDTAIYHLEGADYLLEDDTWEEDYDLIYQLYHDWAEVSYLKGDFQKSQELIQQTLDLGYSHTMDEVELYNLLLIQHTVQGSYRAAFYAGKAALRRLGFSMHEEESEALYQAKFNSVEKLLEDQNIPDLKDAPGIRNQHIAYAIRILTNIESAAYLGFGMQLWTLIVLKAVYLCLKYGHVAESAYAYSLYSQLLSIKRIHYPRSYQFGLLALYLSKQSGDLIQICKTHAKFGGFIQHWRKPLRQAVSVLEQGYQAGIEAGELQFAGYILIYKTVNAFARSRPLSEMQEEISKDLRFAQRNKDQTVILALYAYCLAIKEINDFEPPMLEDGVSDKKIFEEECRKEQSFIGLVLYHLTQAQIHYMYERYNQAWEHISNIDPLLPFIKGMIVEATYHFYSALLSLTQMNQEDSQKQTWIEQKFSNHSKRINEWAQLCPENFLHAQYLLEAEYARHKGSNWRAAEKYDYAIQESVKSGFVQEAAMAHHLTGIFWQNQSKPEFAKPYFLKASYFYRRWGAIRLSDFITTRYSQFFTVSEKKQDKGSSSGSSKEIDTLTLIKASQALSGEIVLSNLLRKLMAIVMENAGAQTGVLLQQTERDLIVQAVGKVGTSMQVLQRQPQLESDQIPQGIINFVARTRKELVLDDASKDSNYSKDPYVQKNQTKSILCFPIINQGEITSIIYLENNLMNGAFTPDRLEVLRVLSSQISISLENAILYENLEEKVRDRTQELFNKNEELTATLHKLQETQTQLVNSAKMASLGQLTAGIAHEINNPINFVSANIQPLRLDFEDVKSVFAGLSAMKHSADISSSAKELLNYAEELDLDYLFEEMEQLLNGIEEGAIRTRDIVAGLQTFSQSWTDTFKPTDIHEGINSTLMLLSGKLNNIKIETNYGEVPLVECIPGKLNQVFMNIIQNAIYAVNEIPDTEGQISISTESSDDQASISIKDNGPGMSPEIKARIFEPFFTTKDVGVGQGLGLSIAFGIIEQHHGTIEVVSKIDQGAEFIVKLPINQEK